MNGVEQKDKKLAYIRIQTILIGCILAVMVVAGIIFTTGYYSLHHSMTLIESDLESIQMDNVNEAVEALTDAANTLSELDIEELNGLIASLNTTAEKLQNTVSGIAGIFGR